MRHKVRYNSSLSQNTNEIYEIHLFFVGETCEFRDETENSANSLEEEPTIDEMFESNEQGKNITIQLSN